MKCIRCRLAYRWIGIALLMMIVVLIAPHTFASSRCNPTLLMIEGGGFGSEYNGMKMRKLALRLENAPRYVRNNIGVIRLDNSEFYSRAFYLRKDMVKKTVAKLEQVTRYPLVIVGHSLGAKTALHLSYRTSLPHLLITLDGVGYNDHQHPGKGVRWVNVWAPDADAWGPDWGYRKYADKNLRLPRIDHYDVERMYKSAEEAIRKFLTTCHASSVADYAKDPLCELPAATCGFIWKFVNKCVRPITVRVFEYDTSGKKEIGKWPKMHIKRGGDGQFHLRCRSPANSVCYGAAEHSGGWWGRGLKGDQTCRGGTKLCCSPCQSTKNRGLRTDRLSC